MFKKLLIANRGEIAVRILRACREMGISPVVVFSEADRTSLHVRLADEAYPIGPAPSRESYLRVDKLIDVARHAACDAVHPGYGFLLAENPALPKACTAAGIAFCWLQPLRPWSTLAPKLPRVALRKLRGCPWSPVWPSLSPTPSTLKASRREIGYPVLLKAVAGGGGKGNALSFPSFRR